MDQVEREAATDGPVLTAGPAGATPDLLLRLWTDDDIPALLAAHSDPVMRRWLRHLFTTAEQARQFVASRHADARAGTRFSFAVLEIADGDRGRLVGSVSLRGLGGTSNTGEVGYWVVSSMRGRGIAPRALGLVGDWAFRSRQITRLQLIHSVGNQASCRVAEKAEFAFSGILPPLPPEFPEDGHLHIRLTGG